MKTLLILRHAKSSWKHPELSDHDRPLNPRGENASPRMGRLLRRENLVPDAIFSSTARRAADTARLAAEAAGFEGEIRTSRSLYLAGPDAYIEALRALPEEVAIAMVVGHNPGVEYLLSTLTDAYERMPTAALAHIQLPIDRWDALTDETEGELLHLWYPRDLPPE